MVVKTIENPLNCGSQNGKAKSQKAVWLPGSHVSSGKQGLDMTTGGMFSPGSEPL